MASTACPPSAWQLDVATAAATAMHRIMAARARRVGNGLTSPLARTEWVVVIGKTRRRVRLSDLNDGL